MKILQKCALFCLTLTLLFSAAGCGSAQPVTEQQRFDAFMEQVFVSAMESDYTTAHTYLQIPENFGVDTEKIAVNLGARPGELYENTLNDEISAQLQTFRRSDLTPQQQDIYDIYSSELELSAKLGDEKFLYYQSYFDSLAGLHFALPTVFADWNIQNERDVQDLILLLKDVKPYMDSALAYTKQQEENGLLRLDLDAVINYCEKILQPGLNSSLLTSMHQNIEALGLDSAKTATYKEEVTQAFTDSFLPAFEAIRTTMSEFKQNGRNHEQGLATLEHGKEYYELLLRQKVGSEKSVTEIEEMMEQELSGHTVKAAMLAIANPEALKQMTRQELPSTNYRSYTAILDDMKELIAEKFPQVSNLNYDIREMSSDLASDSGVTAYFSIPTMDGDSVKQLRVNPTSNTASSIATFSAVAHEGFPGHMYQYAYMYENISSNYIKALASCLGYTEGYAVYAQYQALEYLSGVDKGFLELYRENELASYCLIILADIGIHYKGWTLQDFKEFLNEKGFDLPDDDIQRQYRQLQANPAAFAPYYVGYHEIHNMKKEAKEKLGEKFDEKAFHTALLESGTAPFQVVQRHIDAYVKNA